MHEPSTKGYFVVTAVLMALLVVTVLAAQLPLGPLAPVVALAIAVAKALLIALYFMHMRYASRIVQLFASAALVWLLIMFGLTMGDFLTRS